MNWYFILYVNNYVTFHHFNIFFSFFFIYTYFWFIYIYINIETIYRYRNKKQKLFPFHTLRNFIYFMLFIYSRNKSSLDCIKANFFFTKMLVAVLQHEYCWRYSLSSINVKKKIEFILPIYDMELENLFKKKLNFFLCSFYLFIKTIWI